MLTANIPCKIDLSAKTIKLSYCHPDENDELLLVIHEGKADMMIFKDFLSVYFPRANFDMLSENILQNLCSKLYRQVTKNWLKQAAKVELKKAQRAASIFR